MWRTDQQGEKLKAERQIYRKLKQPRGNGKGPKLRQEQ